jgi:hypothetical protein
MTDPDPPDRPARSTRRRLRLDLALGALGLAAVLGVGKLLSGGSSSSTGPSAGPRPTVHAVRLPAADPSDRNRCPARLRCRVEETKDGAGVAPVREEVPAAHVLRLHSVRLLSAPWDGVLWYRRLEFRVDGQLLEVEVRAAGGVTPGREDVGGQAVTGRLGNRLFARMLVGPYEVVATVPAASGVELAALRAIASDDRLLAS